MERVGVLTDTTAGIPSMLVEELQLQVVPYHVIRGGENLRDGVDVLPGPFADYLAALPPGEPLPTTSFPSPGEYLEGLLALAGRTREIVALTMTARGSGAYQSCRSAIALLAEQRPDIRVEILDTMQVAMAQGWAVIEAARAAAKGATLADVGARARAVAARALMVETADTLRYLYLGGRIGRAGQLVGTLLDIKPLIGMEDGVISALGRPRSRRQAYSRIITLARDWIDEARHVHLAVTHCGALAEAELLREMYFQQLNCVEEMTAPLSPALAVHSGPGTVGLCLFAE